MSVELDIGPLSWVKGEIDLALERAGECLTAYAADTAGDGLSKARASMHQAHGALAIVGLEGITEFADAIEQLLAAIGDGSAKDAGAAIPAAQSGFRALRAYLDDLMAGHPDQPLKLIDAYSAMAVARGLAAPAPSALFFPDLTQRPPKREKDPPALSADALSARIKAARLGFERGLLKWLKGEPKGAAEMKVSTAMIEMTRGTPAARAYWWVAIGVLDAMAAGGLPDAGDAKRFAMRLGALVKKLSEGQTDVPEQALREALYLAACATTGGDALAVVRAAYRLDDMVPTATPSETERLLPVIRRLRDLLAGAKDDWNRLCAGTAAALPPFHERTAKIAEEGTASGQADYQRLTAAILDSADRLRRDPSRHNEAMALEMATALLLAESALENFQSLDAEFAHSTDAVIERLAAVERGEELGMLELPHLDAMSRRAQERLLLESVAREIKSNLGTIETALDAFFRDSSKQSGLAALEKPIRQIQGALLVLGQDRANAVLAECSSAIERFAQAGFAPQAGEFEDVAKKLSALGFFVTQLQGGAADIDAILAPPQPRPAPVREEAEPVAPAAVEAPTPAPVAEAPAAATVAPATALVADEPASAPEPEAPPSTEPVSEPVAAEPVRADEGLPDFEVEGFEVPAEPEPPVTVPPVVVAAPAPSAEAERLIEASEEDLDAELLGIFLEEANEVLGTINANLPMLHTAPANNEVLVTVRRSFHTLKGSGRMVGLAELGEAAWGVEQVLNAWLHDTKPASPGLLGMLDHAATLFADWVKQLEGGGSQHHDYAELAHRCAVLSGTAEEAPAAVAPAPTPVAEASLPQAEEMPPPALPEEEVPVAPEPAISLPELAEPIATAAETTEPVADTGVPQLPAISEAETESPPEPEPEAEPVPQVEAAPEPEPEPESAEVVSFPAPPPVRIGDVEVSPVLYNLYLDEAREHVATLQANLGQETVPGNEVIRAAHTTASISAATGILPISGLARALEDALGRLALIGATPTEAQRYVFARCAGALEGMLGAVAQRRMPGEEQDLTDELKAMNAAIEPVAEVPAPGRTRLPKARAMPLRQLKRKRLPPPRRRRKRPPSQRCRKSRSPPPTVARRGWKTRSTQILPLFLEESVDLMRDIGETLRQWRADPTSAEVARSLQRALHTLKGSARMAGAMGCGELLHSMEDRIDQAVRMKSVQPAVIDGLETSYDRAAMLIERLRNPGAPRRTRKPPKPEVQVARYPWKPSAEDHAAANRNRAGGPGSRSGTAGRRRHALRAHGAGAAARARRPGRPVGQRSRRSRDRARPHRRRTAGLKSSMLDLTENVIRLRKQLREVEIQAESQMQSQQALASERAQEFDPLEFDRFTRFQEVTRMMAESVNDVATVQQNLMRNLDHANAAVPPRRGSRANCRSA
jgi:chemosensory pili system protein ChpA (sensor histidine kinase/response regulator)